MELVKMTLSPKRLSLDEMWQLHKIIGVQDKKNPEYFLDSVSDILKHITRKEFSLVMSILYDGRQEEIEPELFIRGLGENNFFGFEEFVKGMSNG